MPNIAAQVPRGQETLAEAVRNPLWPPSRIGWLFNPPPGWPVQGGDWQPPSGWQPDPSWPPAPPGWQFWTSKIAYRDRRLLIGSVLTAIFGVVFAIGGISAGDAGSLCFGLLVGIGFVAAVIWAGWTTLGWLHIKELPQPQKAFVYIIGWNGIIFGFCIWAFVWLGLWMMEQMFS